MYITYIVGINMPHGELFASQIQHNPSVDLRLRHVRENGLEIAHADGPDGDLEEATRGDVEGLNSFMTIPDGQAYDLALFGYHNQWGHAGDRDKLAARKAEADHSASKPEQGHGLSVCLVIPGALEHPISHRHLAWDVRVTSLGEASRA